MKFCAPPPPQQRKKLGGGASTKRFSHAKRGGGAQKALGVVLTQELLGCSRLSDTLQHLASIKVAAYCSRSPLQFTTSSTPSMISFDITVQHLIQALSVIEWMKNAYLYTTIPSNILQEEVDVYVQVMYFYFTEFITAYV